MLHDKSSSEFLGERVMIRVRVRVRVSVKMRKMVRARANLGGLP